MSEVRIERFEPEHLAAMDMRQLERDCFEADPKTAGKIVALARYGAGGALLADGLVIAVFGYYEMWPGRYEVWAYPSIHALDKYKMLYLKTVKRYVQSIERTHKPKRLQSPAFADATHDRWMRFLGFSKETEHGMPEYDVLGNTYNMWGKTYGR